LRIAISQPRYLPSASYLHRFAAADLFIYLDTVQYSPRDWENRNRLKGSSGAHWVTVPVIRPSRKQTVREVKIDNEQRWPARHRDALVSNYRNAPFFDAYFEFFDRTYATQWSFLIDLDMHITAFLRDAFGLGGQVKRASEYCIEGRGQDLLVALTRAAGGDAYLSGPLGRNYINPAVFERAGLNLLYHAFEIRPYSQLFGEFVPNLSAIDLLFNCGGSAGGQLIDACARIENHTLMAAPT